MGKQVRLIWTFSEDLIIPDSIKTNDQFVKWYQETKNKTRAWEFFENPVLNGLLSSLQLDELPALEGHKGTSSDE